MSVRLTVFQLLNTRFFDSRIEFSYDAKKERGILQFHPF